MVFWFHSDLSVGLGSGKLHSLPLSSVYTWGSGISAPLRLPMLNTEVLQVSLGRTQKMGVTKSGRLITWEVGADATLCLHFEDTQSPLLAFTSFFFLVCFAIRYSWLQAPSVGSGEASLPGVVEQMQPQFISRFLEGQSGVTIKSVSCGDLFTTCMTGQWAAETCAEIKLL